MISRVFANQIFRRLIRAPLFTRRTAKYGRSPKINYVVLLRTSADRALKLLGKEIS
jgi:hypothetical protein